MSNRIRIAAVGVLAGSGLLFGAATAAAEAPSAPAQGESMQYGPEWAPGAGYNGAEWAPGAGYNGAEWAPGAGYNGPEWAPGAGYNGPEWQPGANPGSADIIDGFFGDLFG